MNRGALLFFGVFLTMTSSFWGLILAPQLQIGRQTSIATEGTGQFYPSARSGQARQGAEVYRSLGCVECHSQQVRGLGSDLARGWGRRISVAQDYLYDQPVLIGNLRLGPDLANIGLRVPDANWHLVHLYDPHIMVAGSPMPRYPFLFDQEPENARFPSPGALPVVLSEGTRRFRLVPKPEAHALVAYLLSLRSDLSLFEAPIPRPTTNTPPADASGTNQVSTIALANAASTNTVSTNGLTAAATTNVLATSAPPAGVPAAHPASSTAATNASPAAPAP